MNSAEQTVTWLIALGVLESPKKTISDPEGFLQSSLKDGVVLCRLLDRLLPGTIDKVSARSPPVPVPPPPPGPAALCAAGPAAPGPGLARRWAPPGPPPPGREGGMGGSCRVPPSHTHTPGPRLGGGVVGVRPLRGGGSLGEEGFSLEGHGFPSVFRKKMLRSPHRSPGCAWEKHFFEGGELWIFPGVPRTGCKLVYATAGIVVASPRSGGDSAHPSQPLKDILVFDASFSGRLF